jgi:hypothetical protein
MPERNALPERSATGAGAMPATGSGPGSGPAAPGAGGPPTVHASCVLVGEAGILIEGASGRANRRWRGRSWRRPGSPGASPGS